MEVNFTTEKCNGTNSAGAGVRHDGIWLCPCGGALLFLQEGAYRIKEQSTTNQRKTAALFLKTHFLLFLLTHTGLTAAPRVR